MREKINILLVDDYPANLVALGAVLSDPIYTLIEATSGAEAIEIAKRDEIALILLDVQMPGMDGYEVARALRANPKTQAIPIIFITAVYREEPSVRMGYEAGGQDYMGKPFDPAVLKAKVGMYGDLFKKQLRFEREARSLKESEERYRLIVQGAHEIIATIDANGTITSINLAFERLTGQKCSAWVGHSFLPLLESGDVPNVIEHIRRPIDGPTADLSHARLRTELGESIPVEISVRPLVHGDRSQGLVGVIRDISKRA